MKKIYINQDCIFKFKQAMSFEYLHSHVYQHLASQMQNVGFFGATKYFRKESLEELTHFQSHVDFLNSLGVVVSTPPVAELYEDISTLREAFLFALNKESDLFEWYKKFYENESDAVVKEYLHFFIKAQREAIGFYTDMIARLEIIKTDRSGLLIIDNELAKK